MLMTFRPLIWVGKSTPYDLRRSRSTFKASWTNTMQLLDRELGHLDARHVVIEADFREVDIRLDGMPRSNARQPEHPGVRIAFDSMHGPLIYQTDSCEFWQHNVRSIALGMEALRAVDRYGISSRAEQYQGYRQLEVGRAPRRKHFSSADAALRWVQSEETSGFEGARGASVKTLMRLIAMDAHPDKGGSPERWEKYSEARQLLEEAGLA